MHPAVSHERPRSWDRRVSFGRPLLHFPRGVHLRATRCSESVGILPGLQVR